MPTTSNFYVAYGPAAMAFKTDGARIDYGVNVEARRCGVYGNCGSEFGRDAPTVGFGVCGQGATGGVYGRGSFTSTDSVGLRGEGTRCGVEAYCADGVAVYGFSGSGRGATFDGPRAQVRLVPAEDDSPERRSIADLLPADGKTGDLLALGDGIGATLWFCERGRVVDATGTPANALWKAINLGQGVTGLKD